MRSSAIHAPLPLRLWHLASLDAPTVALVWCMAFASAANVTLPRWVLAFIALGVWSIYIADRCLDAMRCMSGDSVQRSSSLDQLRDRHIFHWRHRRVLIPLAAASALVAASIIFREMPPVVRERDSLLASASLVYFARVHIQRGRFPLLPKEFFVGVLFTLGCALPAWSRAQLPNAAAFWPLLIATAIFASLAWLNCCAIERWESRSRSFAHRSIISPAMALGSVATFFAVALARSLPSIALLLACGALAAFLLGLLDRLRNRLTPVTLRIAADLALLTPAILLALPLFVLR